jgi:hypothetical protein
MSFAKTLERLRFAMRGTIHPDEPVRVTARDLNDLLRDHERLDADARLAYPAHVKDAREKLAAAKLALGELYFALERMPSAEELRVRAEEQSKTPVWNAADPRDLVPRVRPR